ncbi:hypothetical protein TNCV_3637421 [Trichonephila clavipes]|nr:hypothetical protein TNCV_3637421 [Trichonephila clavipes]
MIVQFRNEKGSNHGSIPITIDCNVVAFIVFEEGFHQPIKLTKQSHFSWLGGMVGLSLAFCTQGCEFNPGPSRWIFMMQKIDSGHVA